MVQRIVHPIEPSDLEDAGVVFATFITLETITEGDAVYLNASNFIGRALASSSSTMYAVGIAFRGIASGQVGRVVTAGPKRTSNFSFSGFVGSLAYVSAASVGALRTTPPGGPSASGNIVQSMGVMREPTLLNVAVGTPFQRGGTLL